MQPFGQTVREYLDAGYQCLLIRTAEEARVVAEIAAVARADDYHVICWDRVNGFDCLPRARALPYRDPHVATFVLSGQPFSTEIPALPNIPPRTIFVFYDLDDYFQDPAVRRSVQNLCAREELVNGTVRHPLIIISARGEIHPKLRSHIALLDFALPDDTAIREQIRGVTIVHDNRQIVLPESREDAIVGALRGLTLTEATNAFTRALTRQRTCGQRQDGEIDWFDDTFVQTILDEKASIIRKSEVLTYIPEDHQATADEIGGYDNWLAFVQRRALAYTRAAEAVKLDFPKGAVLLGVPGTGKSMVARAAARLLRLPGYFLDVSAVFDSLVGASEARMRDALRQVEAQRGAVLVLDEVDKAFGGAHESQGDSGVTRRVFGQLLTWLAEKNDRTFVVATLNRTKGLPPEFLRAGRFDRIFYTDLPTPAERDQILKIHLRKRGVPPETCGLTEAQWKKLIAATDGFVGAELEECVREARYLAFERRNTGVPNYDDLCFAAEGIIPMSRMDAENIAAIREFCRGRATPVNRASEPAASSLRTRRHVDFSGN